MGLFSNSFFLPLFPLVMQDDADWSTLGVKEVSSAIMYFLVLFYHVLCILLFKNELYNLFLQGQKLMMMGTADEIVKSPEKGTVFVEDLPEEEQVVAVVSFCCFSLYVHINS